MLFLRKRDADHPFWHHAPSRQREGIPPALLELVRDDQVVIGPDEAARAFEYLRGLGFREDAPPNTRMPVELVDGAG